MGEAAGVTSWKSVAVSEINKFHNAFVGKSEKLGSSGSSVKRLQYALYELKYYDGDITGVYDTATENAVMAFQDVNGLYIDGIAGQDTQRRLFSSNAVPSNI